MKKAEIKIGGLYMARVLGKFVAVRVDKILVGHVSVKPGEEAFEPCRAVYHVTNLSTGRKLTFRSAAKFRGVVPDPQNDPHPEWLDNQPVHRSDECVTGQMTSKGGFVYDVSHCRYCKCRR